MGYICSRYSLCNLNFPGFKDYFNYRRSSWNRKNSDFNIYFSILRINISPSTQKEDIFSRTKPKVVNNQISTDIEYQSLLKILTKSKSNDKFYQNGLIIDEINLGSNELLEMLYSFLLSIFSQNKENNNYYISPDGLKFENFGNISVIGTMNNS